MSFSPVTRTLIGNHRGKQNSNNIYFQNASNFLDKHFENFRCKNIQVT